MQYVYGARLTTFEDSEKESEYGNTTAFYCGSSNLSFGATLLPFSMDGEFPKSAWLVSKMGRLTAGVQYEPQFLSIHMDEQIDGKTLIGSYVCTEKPGEFRWQPGSLTQAVLNGFWVVFEDIDKAPSDVQSILLPLLEGASSFFTGHGEVLLGIGKIIGSGSCPKVLLLNGIHDRETSGFSAACFVTAIADALNRTYGDPHNCLKNHLSNEAQGTAFRCREGDTEATGEMRWCFKQQPSFIVLHGSHGSTSFSRGVWDGRVWKYFLCARKQLQSWHGLG